LLHRVSLGEFTSSEAEYDHHAFLWWAPKQLAVVPFTDDTGSGGTAVGFRVDRANGIAEAGRPREGSPVLRTLVVAGRLFTLTDAGLHAYDLDTLAAGPFTAFRSN
jgi:uncharacterized secreted protein with C-terminal beta-propeller domain